MARTNTTATMTPALFVCLRFVNLKTGLPWSAACSAEVCTGFLGADGRRDGVGAAGSGCCSVAALMHSEEQKVPWAASRRQRAQTDLPQRSQLATAGVSE